MKGLITTVLLTVSTLSLAQGVDYLDHNNTNVSLPRSGNFFYEPGGNPGFEVPNNSGNHMLKSMQFYYMGKDVNGILHASIGGPTSLGQDVFDGPYSNYNNYDSLHQALWSGRSWQICQEEINIFRTWWEACQGPNQDPQACQSAAVPTNEMLTRIFLWPAHGNSANGEDYWMAPFWDTSLDAVYNPSEGDYPLIKGCCATWRVENDVADVHTMSGTDPLGIEMRYMTYQYRNFGLLNDVTFVEVELINRGNDTYPEFVYGIHTDIMVDNYFDDFMGADSSRSLFYTYYGDDMHPSLGQDPPVLGIVALEAPLTSVVDFAPTQLNPNLNIWSAMNGLRSGMPMVDLQGDTTTFLYDDNPNLLGGWSQEQAGGLAEQQAILSTSNGPFAPGDRITQTFAFVYMKDGTRLQSVDALYAAADELHNFYDTISNASCENGVLSTSSIAPLPEVQIMPNPASDYVDIVLDVPGTISITLMDMSGKMITGQEGKKLVSLDISELANGAYFVQIESGASVVTKKLVVDH